MSGAVPAATAAAAPGPAQPAPGQAGERGKSRNMRQLLQLLRYLTPYKLQVGGAIVALVVAAGAVLAVGQAVRRVIDFGFGGGGSHGFLDEYFLALFGVVVVLALATFGRFYLVSWLGERVVADIRKAVYGHVLELSPAFFETTSNGEVLSRLTTDTTLIQTVVGSSASVALRNILLMLGGIVLMAITSLKLTLLVLLIVPLVVVPIIAFGRKLRRLSRTSQDRIADVSAFAGETLYAIQTVQAFTHETVDRKRFGQATELAFSAAVERIHVRAILTALVMLLVFGAVDAIMWIGGKDVLRHVMTPGELTQFVVYAVLVAGASGALSEVWGDLQRAAGAAERLLELLRAEPEVRVLAQPEPLPQPARGAVTLQNVVFHYPARPETSALSDFSLAIAPGETVALVGPSGAGKTTVFQLLQRFYDPDAGTITFDGVDIARADPRALRAHIGLVPQEPAIFAADAWENIRYGRPEASDAEVRAAADAAAASEFLDRLPDGFNAFLGERGLRLSGGQRQRIAIARAILRDPSLLLLDEATSALDAESERLVQQALEKLMVGRTTIVIAHRLATVLKANRIVVLDRGRLVAQGSHAELMAEGGLYARLARLQFDTGAAALATAATAD